MATKTIAITEEAYGRLVALKTPEESFSKEILRITTSCSSIMDLAGSWKDIPEKEIENMKAHIETRRNPRERLDEIEKAMRE